MTGGCFSTGPLMPSCFCSLGGKRGFCACSKTKMSQGPSTSTNGQRAEAAAERESGQAPASFPFFLSLLQQEFLVSKGTSDYLCPLRIPSLFLVTVAKQNNPPKLLIPHASPNGIFFSFWFQLILVSFFFLAIEVHFKSSLHAVPPQTYRAQLPFSVDSECVGAGELCLPRVNGCEYECLCKSLGTFWKPWLGPGQALGSTSAAAAAAALHIPHSLWRRCSLCLGLVAHRPAPGGAACVRELPLEGSRASSLFGRATGGLFQR